MFDGLKGLVRGSNPKQTKTIECDYDGSMYITTKKISGSEQRFNSSQESIDMNGSALAVDNTGGLKDLKITVNNKYKIIPAGELIGPDILNFGTFTSVKVDVPTGYSNISDDECFGMMPYV